MKKKKKKIKAYGEKRTIWCDGKCDLSKGDLGTWEFGQTKPIKPFTYNKWCFRQCDRLNEKKGW